MDPVEREALLDEVDEHDPLFWDRKGRPISLRERLRLQADTNYRFLAREKVGDCEVVTAWLASDQGPFADDPRPQIFGTVALLPDGGLYEEREWFAATEAEALSNHAMLVEQLRDATS